MRKLLIGVILLIIFVIVSCSKKEVEQEQGEKEPVTAEEQYSAAAREFKKQSVQQVIKKQIKAAEDQAAGGRPGKSRLSPKEIKRKLDKIVKKNPYSNVSVVMYVEVWGTYLELKLSNEPRDVASITNPVADDNNPYFAFIAYDKNPPSNLSLVRLVLREEGINATSKTIAMNITPYPGKIAGFNYYLITPISYSKENLKRGGECYGLAVDTFLQRQWYIPVICIGG